MSNVKLHFPESVNITLTLPEFASINRSEFLFNQIYVIYDIILNEFKVVK